MRQQHILRVKVNAFSYPESIFFCYASLHMSPGRNEQERFAPRYLTIGQTVAHYQLADEQLAGEVILTVLEPLIGTSFLGIAAQELMTGIRDGRRIHAEDLYLSFFGRHLHKINPVTDYPTEGNAIIALQLQSSSPIAIDRVLTYDDLREDELMLHQARWDDIYFEHDKEHEQKAFSHTALQWNFYKRGKFLHAIPLTRIRIDKGLTTKAYSHLSEGIHEHTFFVDPKRTPLPYLHSDQQEMVRVYRMLYISPQFSFNKARGK
jgi:hypothetical protein